ncbi:MAG: glutamate-1-semialdehyde 2,1-aminomutase [Aigarchaeota archaeon]|nr:glutamate-1-semialdehyde 2,1-aminomutase [Candidatus Pelearchaeum maunauluense]
MFRRSSELYARARRVLVGGVNSPVRSFKSVGGEPLFIQRGKGCYIYDADGNGYVDYVCSWGALILGHADADVVRAIQEQATQGTSYGASTELEVELAEKIASAIPSIELLRFVNSGTEATMSAIRLARGYTGKKKLVKFEGCYHGHADYLLTRAGSGLATYSIPSSAGVPESLAQETITLPFNDVAAVEYVFKREGAEIAAVIVEPIAGNMGVVPASREFLATLRELTERYNALLIFDEVITGFRLTYGGAQNIYGITPDLTCLGKVIGGGLPIGAYGGREEVMKKLAPLGPVYQAGTLSGNPLSMAAGLATLKKLSQTTYESLSSKIESITTALQKTAEEMGIHAKITKAGSMFSIFFTDKDDITSYDDVLACDRERFSRFFWNMLGRGVYLPPSQFEAMFISTAHDEEALDKTLEAASASLAELSREKDE